MDPLDKGWTPTPAFLAQYHDDLPDFQALFGAVAGALAALIPCDEVIWNGVDRATGRAIVYDAAGLDQGFRNTRAWTRMFGSRGARRQLTIPTARNSNAAVASAWSLNRYGSDFSDEELQLAERLQPLLAILESSDGWRPDPDEALPADDSGAWLERVARQREPPEADLSVPKLTNRELEVLGLLAQGLTAVSIGLRLRISPGTVRKHLEHIYEKTGHRDRLLAVEYAKRSGLLSP